MTGLKQKFRYNLTFFYIKIVHNVRLRGYFLLKSVFCKNQIRKENCNKCSAGIFLQLVGERIAVSMSGFAWA